MSLLDKFLAVSIALNLIAVIFNLIIIKRYENKKLIIIWAILSVFMCIIVFSKMMR
ncbi:MAG: hypothetical protein ACOCRK_07465 [bacterium]